MKDVLAYEQELHQAASVMLSESNLKPLLSTLGTLTVTGSYNTGLMAYPDIDFSVQHEQPDVKGAVNLVPRIMEELSASAVKIADFTADTKEMASYYVGIEFPYRGRTWHIDATVSKPGPIATNPPELAEWLAAMTPSQRETILRLKHDLISAGRYIGSKSKPPYTFRSTHLYEAVLKGGASTIAEAEKYFQ